MNLTIVLRKEVADTFQAQLLYDIVKEKLAEFPNVRVTGKINEELLDTSQEPTP